MHLPRRSNRGLLVVALILAVLTYVYLNDMVKKSKSVYQDPSYKLIKLTAKSVPVKARFAARPKEGYGLIEGQVKVTPSHVTVIGPEALLAETSSAETAIIDISQSTRQTVKQLPLESVAGVHLSGEPYNVEVTVPIEKLE